MRYNSVMVREESFADLPRIVNIRRLGISDKGDYVLSLIALAQFPLAFVQLLLISFGWPEESTTIYRVVLSAASILLALPMILKRKGKAFVVFYFFTIFLYLIHYLLFPGTIEYWHENGFRFLIPICIPTLFCVLCVRNINYFYIATKQICYITAVCCLIYGTRLMAGTYDPESTYFMSYGFLLLLPVIVFFLENKQWSILLSLLFLFLLVVFGSRGPLISVAVFSAYYILRKKKYFLLLVVVIVVVAGFNTAMSYLDSIGISSRTVQMFLDDSIMYDSGRDDIRVNIYKGIQENPILGNGVFGDRALSKGYAHNFFIEVICHFGFLFPARI